METQAFTPTAYPSDLTDAQWGLIAEHFPQGPNSEHPKRALVNAVLYLVNNGCKWRALPHDFPPYSTVHSFYRRARLSGVWEAVLAAMVEKSRLKAGKHATPSYGIIDSQSAKTVYASKERGIDGGKKNKGPQTAHRDRHAGQPARGGGSRGKPSRHNQRDKPGATGFYEVSKP
jgi:putative transposase